MTIETIEARETIEDKVYDLYSELDMTDIQRMSDEQLTNLVNLKMALRNDQPKPVKPVKPIAAKWLKVYSGFEVRDDQLVIVETWRKNGIDHEKVEPCKNRVMYEGKQVSASILKHYLLTGEWIKRISKPAKHRAIVRVGKKVMHLGYFATVEQKDAAIFAFKLGIVPQV